MFEEHGLAFNVVNEPEAEKSDAVLAVARPDTDQLFDWVGTTPVVRVSGKDRNNAGVECRDVGVVLENLPVATFKTRTVTLTEKAGVMLFGAA